MAKAASKPSRKRTRWSNADPSQRCEMILDVAMRLLHRKGPAAVTMRNIAARLSVGTMTLYTYFDSIETIQREMTRRGFALLQAGCESSSTLNSEKAWLGGAQHYLRFALDHPNLYKLMFDMPLTGGDDQQQILRGGFDGLLTKVREQLADRGTDPLTLEKQALAAAGRFWIALHGLASLAIAGRLDFLDAPIDDLLEDLLQRVAPT